MSMPKIAMDRLTPQQEKFIVRGWEETVQKLEQEKIFRQFIEHALTGSERLMLLRRIQIAQLLMKGFTYVQIERKLKVGQKTIEAVHRWLSAFPGYRKIIPEMLETMKQGKKHIGAQKYSFKWLRQKYPIHFLLLNLFLDS